MRKLIAIVVAGFVVIGGAGFAAWWFLIRTEAAPRAKIEQTKVAKHSGVLDGTYSVAAGGPDSFVGYRVEEKLVFNVARTTATGRTSDVTGSLEIQGTTIPEVQLTADLTTLKSQGAMSDRRDNAIRRDGLESDRFPEAKFALTEPIQLDHEPKAGETVKATAHGDFTLHGVTKTVDIAVQGRWDGTRVQVVGSLPILFSDYGIEPPNRAGFVSVDDHGEMEFQLFFSPG